MILYKYKEKASKIFSQFHDQIFLALPNFKKNSFNTAFSLFPLHFSSSSLLYLGNIFV